MTDCIGTENMYEDASPTIDQFNSSYFHERYLYFTPDAILPYLPCGEVRDLCTPAEAKLPSIFRIKPEQTFSRISCGKSIRLKNAVVVFREMNSCNYFLDSVMLVFSEQSLSCAGY
jgi:hypothetical protein